MVPPRAPHTAQPTRVRVWDDHCDGIDQGDAAANWLSAVLEVEGARLVRMKEGARRPCAATCPRWWPRCRNP